MSVTLGKGIGLALVEKAKFPKDKVFKIKVRKNIMDAQFHAKAFVTGGHK
jgi:aminomethyltransferase